MTTLCLKNGQIFDPINKIFNKKKDIYVKDGKIVEKLNEKISETIECKNKIIMPGAIDLHTHRWRESKHSKINATRIS